MLDEHNTPATLRSLSQIVDEYEAKRGEIPAARAAFIQAVSDIETAASIGGTFGQPIWGRYGTPSPNERDLEAALLQSAWKHVIDGLQVRQIATARDLSRLDTAMTNPPAFTLDNIRATFGKYLIDPRHHVLRGVAECFTDLDPAYKSHSKVKIGVEGLPKRIIISGAFAEYGRGWRAGQVQNVLDAMATLHEEPRMSWPEFGALMDAARRGDEPEFMGVTMRGFQNGNAHLVFDREAQTAINKALAEFYGDTLADTSEDVQRRQPSTDLAANLAYYPTPETVAEHLAGGVSWRDGQSVLEPSCGCGRIMDALRSAPHSLSVTGIECHPERVAEARAKGHQVQQANFLQVAPQAIFDAVMMNPPFSGRHYIKHIRHALRFLKPGGTLCAILPASAWYDHGELPAGSWQDLPVASFAESGTNIPTGIFTTSATRT
jgi:hypothetical protein